MTITLRPVIGFSAAFTTMVLVAFAAATAPETKTTLHASAGCPEKVIHPAPATRAVEAERPA